MLKRVELPREGQRIDRVLKTFGMCLFLFFFFLPLLPPSFSLTPPSTPGYQFYEQNRNLPSGVVFRDQKACHSLSFALLMLNTDLHNPNVPNKMTPEQFEMNLTGFNGGENFNQNFLREIYLRIQQEGILQGKGEEMYEDAVKEGWLKCDEGGGGMKQRYVVIVGGDLLVFKKKEWGKGEGREVSPVVRMSLKESMATPLSREEAKGKKFSFLMHESGGKKVLFSAKTQEAVFQWLSAVEMRKKHL